jgi:DegV family protein with EDD domain
MTIIVADTTCGLPRAQLEERGIPVIPQVITFGEESYHDDRELDTATFLEKLRTSPTLPKTAAPEPVLYYPVYEEARKSAQSVIVVAPTGKASGTVRSAQTAALEFPDVDIRVVDSQTISANLGSLVLLADDMAKAGRSPDEILARLEELIPRGQLYFVVDTLEYLARGGRIGGAAKLLADLLEIKPILQVKNGQVEPFERHRTKRRALARLVDVVAEVFQGGNGSYLSVIHVQADAEAQKLVEDLQSRVGVASIPIYELPPAIVVHSGPKAIGLGFFL